MSEIKDSLMDFVISLLDKAVINKKTIAFTITDNDKQVFSLYDDTCGQREVQIIFFDYNKEYLQDKIHKNRGIYLLQRKLSFKNRIDERKEGARLGTFNIRNTTVKSITVNKNNTIIKLNCNIEIIL